MTAWLLNLAAYSLQLAALVASALAVATAMRLRAPRAALWFWQLILLSTVTLPFAQTGETTSPDALTGSAGLIRQALSTSPFEFNVVRLTPVVLLVLVCGGVARLGWLALGFIRLRRVRQRSLALLPTPAFVDELAAQLKVSAEIRISDDVDGPVTIGLLRPTVLLPARVCSLPLPVQRAIVCHELTHVRRRDWAQTVLEEIWCAALWFHPAARLLVSRIALMREALVDQHTVATTGDRRAYAHALMTFAEPSVAVPIAVPSLIRPRHLRQRIALLSREVSMSRAHILAVFAIAAAVISPTIAATAARFPIAWTRTDAGALTTSVAKAVQETPVRPGNGVTLPRVIKDAKPQYTAAAMKAKIQGGVHVEMVVLTDGTPDAIRITRSLDAEHGLDEEAMKAAAQWRFEPGRRPNGTAVPVLITLEMTFTLR